MAVPKAASNISFPEFCRNYWKSGKKLRISTEYLNIASEYLTGLPFYKEYFGTKAPMQITPWWTNGENDLASIFLSFGATEAKPPEDADAIMDVVETGTTLDQNGLVPVETLLRSTAHLVANPEALRDPQKREKISGHNVSSERRCGRFQETSHIRERPEGEPARTSRRRCLP